MNNYVNKEKTLAHVLMIVLVIIWGFDFVPAKFGLGALGLTQLVFIKYMIGAVILYIITSKNCFTEGRPVLWA